MASWSDSNARIQSSSKEIHTFADNYLVIRLLSTEKSQVECGTQGGIFITGPRLREWRVFGLHIEINCRTKNNQHSNDSIANDVLKDLNCQAIICVSSNMLMYEASLLNFSKSQRVNH